MTPSLDNTRLTEAISRLSAAFPVLQKNIVEHESAQEGVQINFGDYGPHTWPTEAFIAESAEAIEQIQDHGGGLYELPTKYYQLVTPSNNLAEATRHLIARLSDYYSHEHITVTSHALVAYCIATKNVYYTQGTLNPTEFFTIAISKDHAKDKDNAKLITNAVLFHLASTRDLVYQTTAYPTAKTPLPLTTPPAPGDLSITTANIDFVIRASEAIAIYNSACQIDNSDLKFFSYYKVLEYFGRAAMRIRRRKLMAMKISTISSKPPQAIDIDELADLAIQNDTRSQNDHTVIHTLIAEIELVHEPYPFGKMDLSVPKFLDKQLKGIMNKSNELSEMVGTVTKAITATRNSISHAKPNYEVTGNECPAAELDTFNRLMKYVTERSIYWFCHLSDTQRQV